MPTFASGHEQFMLKICGVCTLKPKSLQKINPPLLELIKTHHHSEYDLECMPQVICKSCVLALRQLDTGGSPSTRLLPTIDYASFVVPKVTRATSSAPCSCQWCLIGRLKAGDYLRHQSEVKERGRPSTSESSSPSEATIKLCTSCMGPVAKGVSHVCNKTQRNTNLGKIEF